MKKLISLILTTLLLIACLAVPALAENAENEPLVGGWTINAENVAEIPQDVQDALTKAAEELTGCAYEPVALLASQVVSGMNYCLLCKTTVVTPDAPVSYTLVYIYEALDGTAEILRIQDVVFDAFPAENG